MPALTIHIPTPKFSFIEKTIASTTKAIETKSTKTDKKTNPTLFLRFIFSITDLVSSKQPATAIEIK